MAHKEAVGTTEYTYRMVFDPSEEGGYTVNCPSLPGLVTEGDTLEEEREMAADALRCYLESLQIDGLPIPASEEIKPIRREEVVTVRLPSA